MQKTSYISTLQQHSGGQHLNELISSKQPNQHHSSRGNSQEVIFQQLRIQT